MGEGGVLVERQCVGTYAAGCWTDGKDKKEAAGVCVCGEGEAVQTTILFYRRNCHCAGMVRVQGEWLVEMGR